jgi:transposase-like protein
LNQLTKNVLETALDAEMTDWSNRPLDAVYPVVFIDAIHVKIRNTFRYASRKYWDQMAKDLRPVYTAVNDGAAKERFVELTGHLGRPVSGDHPALKSWRSIAATLDRNGWIWSHGEHVGRLQMLSSPR